MRLTTTICVMTALLTGLTSMAAGQSSGQSSGQCADGRYERLLEVVLQQSQQLQAVQQSLGLPLLNATVPQRRQVAFTTGLSTYEWTIPASGPWRFSVTHTNVGNGYNDGDGIFTAPVSGTYVFLLNVMIENNSDYMQVKIVRDGAPIAMAHVDSTASQWNKGTTHVAVQLNKGDRVWVEKNLGDGRKVYGSWWTTFTGFRL